MSVNDLPNDVISCNLRSTSVGLTSKKRLAGCFEDNGMRQHICLTLIIFHTAKLSLTDKHFLQAPSLARLVPRSSAVGWDVRHVVDFFFIKSS